MMPTSQCPSMKRYPLPGLGMNRACSVLGLLGDPEPRPSIEIDARGILKVARNIQTRDLLDLELICVLQRCDATHQLNPKCIFLCISELHFELLGLLGSFPGLIRLAMFLSTLLPD